MSGGSDNRFEDGFRKLDGMESASMDYRQLAALVISMKKPVANAKKNVINKLTRRIKMLKKRKNGEEGGSSKTEKLIDEIAIVKAMEMSRVAKFALANEDTVDNLSRKGRVTPHLLCLTRLAEDKSLKSSVQKWRTEHSDWRILANFLLSKNTSRHFKRSEQKRKITKDSLLVEKELIHKRLETQVKGLPKVDVNQPLIERTSKGKKFKKKGKEVAEEVVQSEVSAAFETGQGTFSEGSASSDEGTRGNNPEDDDLYTFNIVDDELDMLEKLMPQQVSIFKEFMSARLYDILAKEGREVTVSQEDRSAPVDTKTKLIASKLFTKSNVDSSSSDTDSESSTPEVEEETRLPTTHTASSQDPQTEARSADPPGTGHMTKRAINNRKPKSKKSTVHLSTMSETTTTSSTTIHSAPDEPRQKLKKGNVKKLEPVTNKTEEVGNEISTEMVRTVLNIEELANRNVETIPSAHEKNIPAKPLTRTKKSGFFLGGADEIDESLGTSKEEQHRAQKNQRTAGYKGMREKEKAWAKGTMFESLSDSRPKRKPKQDGAAHTERKQRASHNSKTSSNKESKQGTRMPSNSSNKHISNEKGSSKAFDTKRQTKAPSEHSAESLHPSWQASKKRKEQLELMKKGPQGKKIKFDDD